MSFKKINSVFVPVMVFCVTSLVVAGTGELVTPRQTAARQQGDAVLIFAAHQGSLRDITFNPIIFNQVLVNHGSGYNNVTGRFTVPVAGTYQFVFAAQVCRGDHNNHWNFVVNWRYRMLCHAQMSGGATTLNTCYFMVDLKRGDQVWIKQDPSTCAWASSTSNTITFSGILLAGEGVSMLGAKYAIGSSIPLLNLSQNKKVVFSSSGRSVILSSVVTVLLSCVLLD